MARVQSKDDDERSGGGGGDGISNDHGAFDNFLSYLSGESPIPPTTTSGSSSAPANVARVGNDDAATPPSGVEPPIQPSAPPLSELEAGESEKTRSMPSAVVATPVPPPFAPRNHAMASTTTPADVYVIPTPVASWATPSDPPEVPPSPNRSSYLASMNQPPSTGNEAGDASTTLSAPANQGGQEQRIQKYKLGLVSLGLVAAAAIIAAVVTKGVDPPDPPSAAPTSALTSSPTNASSSASPTAIPTINPAATPTSTLTASPLEFPTYSPSEYPITDSPTIAPTTSPSTASPSAPWIWKQQGLSIVGDAEGDLFGFSLAVSADAKTLVVGAENWNNDTGYVKVYRTNDDGWSSMQLIGQSIFGDAVYDYFGWSLHMSPDGKTVAIGAPGSSGEYVRPGYVRVFYLESDFIGSSWNQLGQDITGDANGDQFGEYVSLSDDGKTLAVGANAHDGNGEDSGCVRIYHLEDNGTSNWEQIGQDIYGEAAGDFLGYSLSLSADGTTVVIGAPWNSGNGEFTGQVRVYQFDSAGSTWEQQGQDINGDAVHDYFGISIDISSDGRTLAIGAPGYWEENDRPGYVRVYYLESNGLTSSWTQLGQDIIGEAIGDEFGRSVSLSEDGKTLAIGAVSNDGNGVGSGHVRVYRMDDSSTSWTQLGEDIDGKAAGDSSGWSVSLSADGTTVAIGAPWNSDNGLSSGHVRVFVSEKLTACLLFSSRRVSNISHSHLQYTFIFQSVPATAPLIWKQQGQAFVGDANEDRLGTSVAISADAKSLVVGAPGLYNLNNQTDYVGKTGYVKVYYADDEDWSFSHPLDKYFYGDAVYDLFGWSVSISSDGKILAVGSPGHWERNDRPGYVRVFYLESDGLGSSWKQLGQDITGDADGDEFGWSVSLSGDGKTLAVGADTNDGNGDISGCVRIYHLEGNGTNWEQIGQDIYGEAAGDTLGYSLSLSADGTTVVIGAPWNSGNSEFSGQVRVYQFDSAGSTWEQLGQDIHGEAVHDYFGWSVDISPNGGTLAIGAPGDSENDDRQGYVRVYYLESNDLTSSWTQLGQDIIGEAVGDGFGSSVSLSEDGKTLAIGAQTNDGNGVSSGHVRVYRMDDSSTSWTQLGVDIDGKASYDYSGYAVSLSADGNTVAIGSDGNDDNGSQTGHVRIFSVE